MEKIDDLDFLELVKLRNQVDSNLSKENIPQEKSSFYKALKTLIDLKIGEAEVTSRFEKIEEVLTAMAIGDFSKRLDLPKQKNLFSFIASSLNAVIEEQDANLKKNIFVQATLDNLSDPGIITDQRGCILFVNTQAIALLHSSREDLIDLLIANIFEEKVPFGVKDKQSSIEGVNVKVYVRSIRLKSVLLTVKSIAEDGYLYILKEL